MDATDPVKVLNPYGEPETVDPSELHSALQMGYRIPTPEEVQEFQTQQKYGEGLVNPLKAAAAGAARGATFGLSDQALTKTGLVDPQTLAGLKEANPIASTTGEVGGVLGMALAPEFGLAGAAGEGAEAAAGASRLLNPVKAVSELGSAATDAASPLAERVAGAIANPDAHAIANRMLQKGVAHGLGSAVEGAAYGLGQSVSEEALGDPDALGEKLLSNVGLSALFAGGMGGLLGATAGALPSKLGSEVPKEIPGFEKPAQTEAGAVGDFEQTIRNSGLAEKEKDGILSGLSRVKKNAGEIKGAAQALDAPVLPGMISDSEAVQRGQDALLNGPPTVSSSKMQALAQDGWEKASSAVDSAIGDGSEFSKASVGDKLRQSLISRFEGENAPIKALYDELHNYTQAVPISEKSTGAISRNVAKLIEEHSLIKGTPEYNLVQSVSDGLSQVKDLDSLKAFRTTLGRNSGPETRFVSGLIREKLDNLEESAIKRFAETMKTPDAKAKILDLINKSDEAKTAYKALREKMERFGDILGKRKIYGPQDFLDFLEETTPEKFAQKLFAKNNSEFMGFFSKEFPQEMSILRDYQLNLMRQKATKDGYLNLRALFKQVNGLEPEIRQTLFSPGQLARIKQAETYINAFPKNFNPSGSAHTLAFRDAFDVLRSGGITGAISANARDYAIEKFITHATKMDPVSGEQLGKLIRIERAAQKTAAQIASGTKKIFKTGIAAAVPVAAVSALSGDRSEKKLEKIKTELQDVTTTPEKALDVLHNSTHDLFVAAPKTASGVQMASLRAAKFLASKLPNQSPLKLLDPKSKPSPADLSKFFKYYEAVNNPTSVLDRLAHGVVTPESIEALHTVYPKLYGEMKSSVMEELTHSVSKGKHIPYRTKVGLSMFLGQDLDSSTTPASIQATQAALASQSKSAGPGGAVRPSQGGLSALTMSQAALTPNQSSSQRGDV